MHTAPRLVKVVWLDARGTAGWSTDPLYDNPPMYSIGYVVGERGSSLYLAATWDGSEGSYADVSCIPTGCILATIDLVERPPG